MNWFLGIWVSEMDLVCNKSQAFYYNYPKLLLQKLLFHIGNLGIILVMGSNRIIEFGFFDWKT